MTMPEFGARYLPGRGTRFRVWAPSARRVRVVPEQGHMAALDDVGEGWHQGVLEHVDVGDDYRLLLDQRGPFPDPASRFQPDGPHGPSRVVDPGAFRWTDDDWTGPAAGARVVYEMHVGTFTAQGTYAAAAEMLPWLRDLGVTVVEMMPVADFPGRFGWGYDGVDLFAPSRLYGSPDDLRAFVDCAHSLGLGVILDVVYNHLGPDGNVLAEFSPDFFTDRYANEWGQAINFDGANAAAVRAFFVANAAYWIDEYHFDGLRLDATQSMHDGSHPHILADIVAAVRAAARGRRTLVIAENEPQQVRLLSEYGLDGLWNDDFHHNAMVTATGRRPAYYMDYGGSPQEWVSVAKRGFLYQGQFYAWQGKRRGSSTTGVAARHWVNYLQNHDQVANSAWGERLHQRTSPDMWRVLTALLLLLPGTPMLFQGQEFAASAPFLFFADHDDRLAAQVARGRAEFMAQFPGLARPEMAARLADPGDLGSFRACVLDHGERTRHRHAVALHRDLLALRRDDPVIAAGEGVDGAALAADAFCLRWFAGGGDDRLLVVALGADLTLPAAPEPLLAPPGAEGWRVLWSSEHPDYGGGGTPPPETRDGWHVAGRSAVLLAPKG